MGDKMNKWLNIDMHMHSYGSIKYDSKRVKVMPAKEFVDILLEKKIDLFSITDHDAFCANFYKEIFEYINDKDIGCIPGCELNVYVPEAENNKFHANFYFPLNVNFIELERIIQNLYVNNSKPSFSEIIDSLNKLNVDFIIFPEANKSAGISNIIRKLIDNKKNAEIDKFLQNGMQRIFKAYDSTEKFNKTSADHWALSYYKVTEEFKESFNNFDNTELEEIISNIKKRINGIDITGVPNYDLIIKTVDLISKYGNCFSYFHFSDWHNNEVYNPEFKNYIYGCKELPFESLELAVLDPVSRIYILPYSQNISMPLNNIKSIMFKINNKENKIDFSIGLNAIVGKRASGKSLLMAILLKLYDKDDKALDKYKKYYKIDPNLITCETFEGQNLTIGQLGSVKYISQNTISSIFEDPTFSENGLKEFFPKIEEPDTSYFDELLVVLKNIKVYNKNYKALNSFIKNLNIFNTYAFGHISQIDDTKVNNSYKTTITSMNSFIKDVKDLGFSSNNIEKIIDALTYEKHLLEHKIQLYNGLFTDINGKIQIIINNNTSLVETMRLARNDCQNSKKIIFENFDILLSLKKAEYLIDNFKIDLPCIRCERKNDYLFVSSYAVISDMKNSLVELIENNIVKQGHSEKGIELVKLYINGETKLKSTASSIYFNLEKKFITNNLQINNRVYEILSNINIDELHSYSDVDSLVRDKSLEDISNSSLGRKSIAYLELMLDSDASILLFDQPEDNVDNNYISNYLVPLIKEKKKTKQLIFITHNPSVAVYADAFNYIYAVNDSDIEYSNHHIESLEDKKKILEILDGGSPSFSNRNLKYGNIIGEYKYAVKH